MVTIDVQIRNVRAKTASLNIIVYTAVSEQQVKMTLLTLIQYFEVLILMSIVRRKAGISTCHYPLYSTILRQVFVKVWSLNGPGRGEYILKDHTQDEILNLGR